MKNKKILWSIFLAIFALIIVGYLRYQQVNSNLTQSGVTEEKFFQQKKVVHAYHVNFIIHQVKLIKSKNKVSARVQLSLHQTGTPNYGMKKNYANYIENFYLNNPYGLSNPVDTCYDRNNHLVGPYPAIVHAKQPVTLHFSIPRNSYNKRTKKLRISFLVPTKKHYVKYSLLLE